MTLRVTQFKQTLETLPGAKHLQRLRLMLQEFLGGESQGIKQCAGPEHPKQGNAIHTT